MSIELIEGLNEFTIPLSPYIGATLDGNVDLEGRPATAITISFFEPGTDTEVLKADTTTDSNGNFTVEGIPPGTYDVAVKGYTSLSILKTNEVFTDGEITTVNFGVLLEGDANGDDWVDISDLLLLQAAWSSRSGQPDWNPRCDFNRDGYITGADRGLLYSNWNKHGDCAGPPAPCTVGETACVGYDLYTCNAAAKWELTKKNAEECGYVPPPVSVPTIQQFFVVTTPRDHGAKGPYEVHCLIKNEGEGTGTHKVTLYCDGEEVRSRSFTIAPGETYEYVYNWDFAPRGSSGTWWAVGDWGEETPHIYFIAGYGYSIEETHVDCTAVTATTAILRCVTRSEYSEWRIICDDVRWPTIKTDKRWSTMWCALTGLLPRHTYEAEITATDYGYRSDWTTFTTR